MATSTTYGNTATAKARGGAAILRDTTHYSDGPGPDVMDAATLKGDDVVTPAGDKLGTIESIMLDVSAGRIAYAVLSCGGVLGMGNKLFAIPWSAFTLDAREKRFILDVPRERLDAAPGFDKDHWPSMADRTWATDIHTYYDVTPYWDERDDTLSASSG